MRDGTLMQGRAVGWDLTSASGRTSGERRLTFRWLCCTLMFSRHPASWPHAFNGSARGYEGGFSVSKTTAMVAIDKVKGAPTGESDPLGSENVRESLQQTLQVANLDASVPLP